MTMTTLLERMNRGAGSAAKAQKRGRISWLQLAMHLAAWLPLALLIVDARSGNLTVNPIQEATQRMGRAAILMLMASLSITPLRTITGIRSLQRLSRPLGLYAFFYALIHLFLYAGVDYGFDFSLLIPDLVDKKYIYIGIASFLILVVLAATSFRWWMKRLGKRWKQLHRLVYAAGVLVVIHYALAVKGDPLHLRGNIGWPVFYGVLVVLLLGVRVPVIRKKIIAVRER
jgi:sulfoxide reductase heme-binding subunit YedZ